MCIHIFATGKIISIPLLFEQIWLRGQYQSLDITEVYDVVIHNIDVGGEDDSTIHELYVLYPHDIRASGGAINASLEAIRPDSVETDDWNWYHTESLTWLDSDETYVQLSFTPQKKLHCRSLNGTVSLPDQIASDEDLVASLDFVRKTLFRVKLSTPLKKGEKGLLRLCVRPNSDNLSTPTQLISKAERGASHPHRFSWDLRIDSTVTLRAETKSAFRRVIKTLDSTSAQRVGVLRDIYRHLVLDESAAVSVDSHKIAIVYDGQTQVSELTQGGAVKTLAAITPIKSRAGEMFHAHLWQAGALANPDDDVWTTCVRIMEMLIHTDRHETFERIVQKLAMPDKQESVGIILEVMRHVGILDYDENRKMFRLISSDVSEQGLQLQQSQVIRAFESRKMKQKYKFHRVQHSYYIDYRVTWEAYHPAHEDEIDRTRKKVQALTTETSTLREQYAQAELQNSRRFRLSLIIAIASAIIGLGGMLLSIFL